MYKQKNKKIANNQIEFKFPKGAIITIAIILTAIVLISKSAITIGSGERGVLYQWIGGVVTDKPP